MFKTKFIAISVIALIGFSSCGGNAQKKEEEQKSETPFEVISERFGDVQMLRYQITGFEELSLKQKELAYYLYEAALSGRDIIWDQKYRHNLLVRRLFSALQHPKIF